MRTIILLLSSFLFSLASFSQSHDVDKSASTRVENNVVAISSAAVPIEQVAAVAIDSSNYHKATGGFGAQDPAVDANAAAEKPGGNGVQPEKKEIIASENQKKKGAPARQEKMIEIKSAAVRR